MISIIVSIIKVIVLLGLLIGIHETGHFLVAKKCKVRVNEFSIGFGPKIFQKNGKETTYTLRLIPLGGYVNMEGESEHSDKEGSFTKASISKRIAIVLAGAMVNIIFAIVVYFVLMATATNNVTTIVDKLVPNYAAENSGIEVGDKIIKVNGTKVKTTSDINDIVSNCNGEEITVTIEKQNGEEKDISIIPTQVKYKSTGIYLYNNSTKIAEFVEGGTAEKQGLQIGDTIISINGEDVKDNQEKLLSIINDVDTTNLNFKIDRAGKEIEITIIPEEKYAYYIGVQFKTADVNFANNMYYAGINTKEFLLSIIDNLKQLFLGKVSTDQLMGPVGISEMVSKTSGIKEFVYMLALISLSLGITNLIPFPPLDGGKILLLIIEAIRRKPIKEEVEVQIGLIGFAVLIGLSIFVTYHDILRIL